MNQRIRIAPNTTGMAKRYDVFVDGQFLRQTLTLREAREAGEKHICSQQEQDDLLWEQIKFDYAE